MFNIMFQIFKLITMFVVDDEDDNKGLIVNYV